MRLQALAKVGKVRQVSAGEAICRAGQAGDELFLVLSGSARLERSPAEGSSGDSSEDVGPGSLFGEMSALEGEPYAATVVATAPTTLVAIGRAELLAAIEAEPELALRMLRVLSGRVRALSRPAEVEADPTSGGPETAPVDEQSDEQSDEPVRDGAAVGDPPPAAKGPVAEALALARADDPLPGWGDERFVYIKQQECPVCGSRFEGVQVRASRLSMAGTDLDLRVRYNEFDPLWYRVWVCPRCRYAGFSKGFGSIGVRAVRQLRDLTPQRLEVPCRVNPDAGSPATIGQAIDAVRLALVCSEAAGWPAETVARLWLFLSWMCADLGQAEERDRARREALAALERAYEESQSEEASQRIAYLAGVLQVEAANWRKAHEYLLRAIYARGGKEALVQQARDLLASVRAARRSAEEGPSETP